MLLPRTLQPRAHSQAVAAPDKIPTVALQIFRGLLPEDTQYLWMAVQLPQALLPWQISFLQFLTQNLQYCLQPPRFWTPWFQAPRLWPYPQGVMLDQALCLGLE